MGTLRQSRLQALNYVRCNVGARHENALDKASALVKEAGIPVPLFAKALTAIQEEAPIDVSFHPDRPNALGKSVTCVRRE